MFCIHFSFRVCINFVPLARIALTVKTYTDGGWLGLLHNALITNLKPNTRYYYQCGDLEDSWSTEYFFTTPPLDPDQINVLVVGDMGFINGMQTANRLIKEIQTTNYHFLLHNGGTQLRHSLYFTDCSYAEGDQPIWDKFMRAIQPIAAYIPYMVIASHSFSFLQVSPGNHDAGFNFTSMIHRFPMPSAQSGSPSSLYWSIDYPSKKDPWLHLLSFATDYFPADSVYGFQPGTPQYQVAKWFLRCPLAN